MQKMVCHPQELGAVENHRSNMGPQMLRHFRMFYFLFAPYFLSCMRGIVLACHDNQPK